MDENRQMLLADLLRNAKGMGSAARAVVQPMIGEIPAGLSGLGTMMLTGDMDKAAENTRAVQSAFEYEPNERGAEYLQSLGRGAGKVYGTAKRLDPKLEGNVAALRGDWEKFANAAPGVAAITAGVVGAGFPEGRGERAVAGATERAAAKAAARDASHLFGRGGKGEVPNNIDVDYFGFQREMTPDEFLANAADIRGREKADTLAALRKHAEEGGKFGNPFLSPEWDAEAKVWRVDPSSHEGRHRMNVVREMYGGDARVPVHIFPSGMRARNLTDEMRNAPIVMNVDPNSTEAIIAKAKAFLADVEARNAAEATPTTTALRNKKQATRQFPEYAEDYPPVPEPVMQTDPKSGKQFLGKGSSPETEEFMAARREVQRQMDKEGFTPFYDPAQRFDADPSYYQTGVDTYTQGLPKKQATVDKWRAQVQTDDARQRLQDAFDAGNAAGGNDRWYQMGQVEKSFIDELGPEEGRKAFAERFGDAMAATTGGADPTSNWLMAQYGNVLRSRGQKPPANAYSMPVPIGGRYVTGNMGMYDKIINEGQGIGVGTPKRHNFSANFKGDRSHSTIDEQMTDLITPGLKAPPGDSYFAYEELVRDMANKNAVEPRDFQDVAWGGKKSMATGGKYKGSPMVQHINESIERTSRLTGMSPEEVVRRGLVRGEIPMYGVAAASALGAGMYANDKQKEKIAALRGT